METATQLIVIGMGRQIRVTLSRPWCIGELWSLFVGTGVRPVLTLSGGIARATF